MRNTETIPTHKLHHHDGCAIEHLLPAMPELRTFEKASDTFRLISDPTRLQILWLLCHSEACVNNIAFTVGMSAPAVSHHLRHLKQAELLSSRRDGKEIYYKLADNQKARLIHETIDKIMDI